MHTNVRQIETLYSAIANGDPDAVTACYADDAYFEDIAFQRHGRKEIHEMWRMVCHTKPMVAFWAVIADDQRGNGHWTADYMFDKTGTNPGRRVVNNLTSAFTFRNGLIVTHHDHCDAKAWARQAYSFPVAQLAGSVPPLRHVAAARKLGKFLKSHP